MHHNIGLLEALVDKMCGLFEELTQVKLLVVFSADLLVVGNIGGVMFEVYAFGGGEYCLNGVF